MSGHRRDVAAFEQGDVPGLATIAVVLPAWQPDGRLEALAEKLLRAGFSRLVVVDDGSAATSAPIFASLQAMPGVSVLRHEVNCGKGRALKTAFAEVLQGDPEITGVVTADADGQHTAEDIVRVAQAFEPGENRIILGVRRFKGNEVPWRSRMGNNLTRGVFSLLSGRWLCDTQTGLRGLPRTLLPELIEVAGERYEYEMVMLASLCHAGVPIVQEPIQTVYLEGNRGSHFRPVPDSLRVYRALLRFYAGVWGRLNARVPPHKRRLRAA